MARTILLICFLLSATACTWGSLYEREHFAQYSPGGEATYYRITLDVKGHNGKLDYYAGWFDAQAVDAVFGSVATEESVHSAKALRQRRALAALFDDYMTALEKKEPNEVVAAARGRYEEALGQVGGMASLGDAISGPLTHAGQKFVMILSHNPQQIIDAINAKVREMEIGESLGQILTSARQKEIAGQQTKLELLGAQAEKLQASLREVREGLDPATATNGDLKTFALALLREVEAVR